VVSLIAYFFFYVFNVISMKFFRPLFLLAGFLFYSVQISSQDIDLTLSPPAAASICGPEVSFDLTFSNNDNVDAVALIAEVLLPTGVALTGVSAPGALSGNEISIGDLDENETVVVTVTFQMNCEFTDDDLEFSVALIQGGTGDIDSESIQILSADLSIPTSSPAVLPLYLGLETEVRPRLVNNGFGELSEVTYCVSNNISFLALQGILVGSVDITAPGPAFSAMGQDCYIIDMAAIQSAGLGDTYGQGESIFPIERWLVTACSDSPQNINRRLQFGCQSDRDCQDKPQSNFISTGVNFELLAPDIDASVVSSTLPACYADEASEVTIRLTNEGTAPAKNIRFRIFTDGNGGRGMVLDLNSLVATSEVDGSALTDISVTNQRLANDCRAPGVRDASLQLNDVDLEIGESILITYQLTADCGCNDCDVRNKYWSRFRLEGYDDLCDEDYRDQQNLTPNNRFDAFITGFPEGPSSLFSGNEGCITYYVTDMQLDWLNGRYPDAALTANFALPCGLDFVPGSFTWTDRDGMSFTAASVSYTDNGNGADDMLSVVFEPTGRPSGFNYAGGAQFDFCVDVDCSEKPEPACGNAYFDVVIDAQFDFTTDPTCPSSCSTQKIWKPQDLDLRLVCPPTITGCDCDGITFTGLDIERTNFGIPDADNNQVPGGTITSDDIESDRFLPGDTIKVTLQGRVNDADDNRDFDFGFVTYPFIHQNFTPLSARVAIYDASNGNTLYECTAVPVTPDYANQQIVVDYSRDALNNFGCGLPAGFLFEDGDSIAVCLSYTEKDAIEDPFRIITYEPRFYLSEDDFGAGTVYQCNPLIGRMTQVGFSTDFDNTNDNFGACEQPSWTIRYDRYIGGAGIDEFPNEIRPLGFPDRLVFTKPSEFGFRLDEWDLRIEQRISPSNTIVDTRSQASPSIPAQYFIVNGDEVTFLIGDYLESLGNAEIPPDEGYRVSIYPRIQGNCESVEAEYDYSYQFFERVEENIFCTDEIANPPMDFTFEYLGAARLVVLSDLTEIRLCSGNDMATIRVRNLETSAAANAFLFPQQTGGVIITRIEDNSTGVELLPNAFGIYELGQINGTRERVLKVFFTKNTCGKEVLNFIAGWDCLGYPTTRNDALCLDRSSVVLTSASSSAAMVVKEPEPSSSVVVDLCDPVPYEVDILSSDLGYLRDLSLLFRLPPGQSYVPGSLMFSYPSPALGGNFVTVGDPVEVSTNNFLIDVSELDPSLDLEGLAGSKDPENSIVSVRFLATTECGYISGSRARFTLASSNSCGDPLRPINRRSGRVRIRPDEPTLSVSVEPATLELNACNVDTATTGVFVTIESGEISNLDSIRMLLPPGINYIADSYVPGTNAIPGINPVTIRNEGGQTVLVWPFQAGLSSGDMVAFDVDLSASDVGQLCTDSEVIVEAYASFEAECNGMICSVGELSGDGVQAISIQKADFDFNFVDGSIVLNPDDGTATADFTVKLTNFGFELDSDNTIAVDIYEDVNSNGSFDEGTDVFLFQLDTTLVEPLLPGACIFINDQATFPATNICTVIGVLDPDQTCTCSELPSETFRPEIIFNYETEFDVCSGESIVIGPDPVAGYTSEWLSVSGSDLGNLSVTDNTPTTFTAPANNTGAPITVSYTLRTANAPCLDDQQVNVTIAPAVMDQQNVSACMDASYDLPTVTDPNASNFVWSPAAGLTISPDGRQATINNVSASETYTLTYEIGDGGCPATYTINLTAINCGGSNTALGDTVFFDFNEDGLQSIDEPGIAGVTVNLLDANTGAVISTTVTNADGFYIFDMLPAGNYAVEFIPLPGFVLTMNDEGGDDANDSDADPITGITPAIFLPLDVQDFTFDAGFIPDCSLSVDLSVSECIPSGDTLARRLIITTTWDGNPFTYDQFGDGNDTIDIDLNGFVFPVVVSELASDSIVLDTILRPEAIASYTVSATFRQAVTCQATADQGPFDPCVVDLALTKAQSTLMPTPGPYVYGDLICMDITVYNQGEQTVQNVQVFDSLPAGFIFNAANSPDWTDITPLQLYTFSDPIAPGESVTTTICVNLEMVTGDPTAYTNIAEINSFQDTLGNDISDFDEDSTPDTDFGNDPGGAPNSLTDGSIDGDGMGVPGGIDPDLDEDDSDPFAIDIFDLALVKMLETDPFYAIGDVVTYSFEVINQGNITAENIRVIDYIPEGFSFEASNSPPWGPLDVLNATIDTTSTVISGPLLPGDTARLTIDLRVAFAVGIFNRVNRAEIVSATGPGGLPVTDIDSTPDNIPDNDPGGIPLSGSDDATDGDGTGVVGDPNPDTDEDDADPSLMTIDSVSLGSTVFIDPNNNGMQDVGEFGVADVVIELLLDANGDMMITAGETTPVATTLTGPNGNYYFGMLVPGNYQVQIPVVNFGAGEPLQGFGTSSTPTSLTDDNVDGNDDGSQPGGAFTVTNSPTVRLIPTMEFLNANEGFQGGTQDVDNGQDDANGNMTVDFGFLPNVSIGSTVFADYDDNGMQDIGEPGVPLVSLNLYYDANNDGTIDGLELTPISTTSTDALGDYFFGGLAPGNYQVGLPATEFGAGEGLEFLPTSSTDIGTTGIDNTVDGDDNGIQSGGTGTDVLSPLINLEPGMEPTDAQGETAQGTDNDDDSDASGDMTVDFGFICNLEITVEDGPFTTCSNKPFNILQLATIIPSNVNGTWTSTGDGTFLDATLIPVSPARYADVVYYLPGTEDGKTGTVELTLITDAAGVCPPISATMEITVLNVDCGSFFWDGQ
jgi:uncharacterized repeat protein (TIGR01451 family)